MLFRNHPDLALDLLIRRGGVHLPEGCTPCSGDPALVPGDPAMEADAVTLLKSAEGVTRYGIVVALPVSFDEAKKRMWARHGEALEVRERAECSVLVVAVTHALAAWAKAPTRPQIWIPRAKPGQRVRRIGGSPG